MGVMPVIEQRLPLTNHPEHAVVHDDDHNGHVVADRGGKLVQVHPEAAVACDEDAAFPRTVCRTDCRAEAVTHGSKSAAGCKSARCPEDEILRRPHLMLTDIRADGGVFTEIFIQCKNCSAGRQSFAGVKITLLLRAESADLCPPFGFRVFF